MSQMSSSINKLFCRKFRNYKKRLLALELHDSFDIDAMCTLAQPNNYDLLRSDHIALDLLFPSRLYTS